VFYVCAAVSLFGALAFGLLAQGEVQPWAIDPDADTTLYIAANQNNGQMVEMEPALREKKSDNTIKG
jgi:hypothetical protein